MPAKRPSQQSTEKNTDWIRSPDVFLERLAGFRRDLHRHPETAFEEQETARRVKEFLAQVGLEPVAEDIAGHGLLFRLDGKKSGPRIMLESDLDALPLQEKTGKEYTSTDPERHHACGHDGHMAMLAGALLKLAIDVDEVPGTVYALFQPAEETGEGAEKVLEDPRVRDLKLDGVYAIHNLPGYPQGSVIIRAGTIASASVGIHFRFHGETSHAAAPHKGRSAVAALSQLALRAPGVPSDTLAYAQAALVTPIHLEAGQVAYGTAAGSGSARFTVRAASDDDLESVCDRLTQEAQALAQANRLEMEVEKVESFPATKNAPEAADVVIRAAHRVGLPLVKLEGPLPWSEDFGHFNRRWPGALLCFGAGEKQPELHRPDYDFPDTLLAPGVEFWVALVKHATAQDPDGTSSSNDGGTDS